MAYTYTQLKKWTQEFLPYFLFSQGPEGQAEFCYPIDADGWLGHVADEDVTEPPRTDPNHRGTAVYRWRAADDALSADQWASQSPRVHAGDLTLDARADGIGTPAFRQAPPADPDRPASGLGDWFLDVGGWGDEQARTTGQMGYLWDLYRETFDHLGLPPSAPPTEPIPSRAAPPPSSFTPDDRALHTYAELTKLDALVDQLLTVEGLPDELSWLSEATSILADADASEFLRTYDVLTYHLLYPGRVPPAGLLMEGQWEAISIFLSGLAANEPEPGYATYSQGYAGGVFPLPRAACREWREVETSGRTQRHPSGHPLVYVAWGSHTNYFTPTDTEQADLVWDTLGVLSGMLVSAGLALLLFGALLPAPLGPVVAVVGLILLIIGLLLGLIVWVAGLVDTLKDRQNQGDLPSTQDNPSGPDQHGGDGMEAGGSKSGTPDDPPPDPDVGGTVPVMVHPLADHPQVTDSRAEPPQWWHYVGRWGVCVSDAEINESWSNGVWRRWPNGYTLTHRNVEAFIDLLHAG